MPRYAAFLRAVNVGGRTVQMDALRAHFAGMGFGGVETFIASGNVVFDSSRRKADALETLIERGLEDAFGFSVATFVRTVDDVGAIAARDAFGGDTDGCVVYVGFLRDTPTDAARARVLEHASAVDSFETAGREIYWRCRKSISQSDFSGSRLEKAVGGPATLRNMTTIRRMAARFG